MQNERSSRRLSALIGLIYDCVIEPDRWQPTIDALRAELGFATAEIAVVRLPNGEPLMTAIAGIEPEWLQRFQQARAAGAIDLWGGPERVMQYPLAEPMPMLAQALALLYDLTPAEVRVFESVVAGATPAEIAARLGLAPSTVKTHLLRVFDKTGCRRQADLVRLASSLTA